MSAYGQSWRDPIYAQTKSKRVTAYVFICPGAGCGMKSTFHGCASKPRDERFRCHKCGRRFLLNPRKQ
jgi:transposase-like protein